MSWTTVCWQRPARVGTVDQVPVVEKASYDVDDAGHVVIEEALLAQLLLDAGWERTS